MNLINEIQPGKSRVPTLVVIDDEEYILSTLKSLFRKEGYQMHFFSSPVLALEFLRQHETNVLITDMRMPEMGGTELLEYSADICPNAIRLIISGYEQKSVILSAISRGLARNYIMKPWDDEQLKTLVHESMELQQTMRQKHLQDLLLSFKNLPSPPQLHKKLKKILEKTPLPVKEITNEIEKSPALVAKLLRMSNSVCYSSYKNIKNVFDAISFVGTEEVLNIVLSLESFDSVCAQALPEVIHKTEDLREKSILRAQIAREISLRWNVKVDPEEAYVAGLMLDIGLMFRFCSSRDKFNKFFSIYNEGEKSMLLIDKEIYTISHDEVGEALLSYWNFSPEVITAVGNHHRYACNNPLTTIVQLADLIVQGKDSLPHDPCIDGLAEEWKIKLTAVLEKIYNSQIS
jgi:HD-like signal output (HDOD) protein